MANPTPAYTQIKPFRGAEYRTIQAYSYGRFEVRMRSANVSGMLTSFFTYYDPASPWNEIDIENMGRYTDEVQFNTITPTQADNHVQRQKTPFNPHEAFHVYGFEWTPDYVAWLVDSVEVYRQTGTHIATITHPQKIMMNVWQPSAVDWAGPFSRSSLPVYGYYDWVKYYAYTPGTGENFTVQWTDDFNGFDATRWQKGTHTWAGNNSQFVPDNVVFQNGYMILCLTDSLHSGYAGGPVVDSDVDKPYLISARATPDQIHVLFSEALDKASAENKGYYVVSGLTVSSAVLGTDGKSVTLNVSGLDPNTPLTLSVFGVKDVAGRMIVAAQIKVVMPLALPVRINVGGGAWSTYLADSVWDFSKQYGAIGGTVVQVSSTVDIAGTDEDDLFRSAREGITAYSVRLPNGTYRVTLLAAETKYTGAGERVFDVKAEGQTVVSHVDLIQRVGSNAAASVDLGPITITDEKLDLCFMPVIDKPTVGGILVEPVGTGVGEEKEKGRQGGVEEKYELGFFPNPFNGETRMTITLPRPEEVAVHIYDTLGRRVAVFPLGYRDAGQQTVIWSAGSLASGVYLCRLEAGREVVTRRVVIVK